MKNGRILKKKLLKSLFYFSRRENSHPRFSQPGFFNEKSEQIFNW